MALTPEERELFEEKFKGLERLMTTKFDNLEEKLERIETQTTKTNGRVGELERKELTHTLNCPQAPKIQKINDDLAEYRMIMKYPKLFVAGFVVVVILTLGTFLANNPFKAVNKPLTEVVK